MESAFILGLINEERDSLASQLSLWHHLTLRNILQRKFTGWIFNQDALGSYLQEQAHKASKEDISNLKAWKLNEIMLFLKIPSPEKLDLNTINAIGKEIEAESAELLRKVDKNFKGTSPDEMVRYLLIQIVEKFSAGFSTKDKQTQNEIIKNILEILHAMPLEQQNILKELLCTKELSQENIRQAIFDHTLTTALDSFMMMVKYTVYYEISKIALVLSGAVSFYLAKPYIKPLIPMVLFLFSPFAMGLLGVGLTWWTDVYTNKQIQSFLLPVMVMSSILASVKPELESPKSEEQPVDYNINDFIEFYNHYHLKG